MAAKRRRRKHRNVKHLPPLGSGARFSALVRKLSHRKGKYKVRDPRALAAAIGRKKYGSKAFQKLAARGKWRHKAAGLARRRAANPSFVPLKGLNPLTITILEGFHEYYPYATTLGGVQHAADEIVRRELVGHEDDGNTENYIRIKDKVEVVLDRSEKKRNERMNPCRRKSANPPMNYITLALLGLGGYILYKKFSAS
jgi:hypothetical protein